MNPLDSIQYDLDGLRADIFDRKDGKFAVVFTDPQFPEASAKTGWPIGVCDTLEKAQGFAHEKLGPPKGPISVQVW